MQIKHYVATFTEEMLATKPNDEEVHKTFIAGKERELHDDELTAEEKTLAELDQLEKGKTIYHRDDDGCPIIWNYQVKGFLKEAFSAISRDKDSACSKVKAFRKIIANCIFVEPRKIKLELPEGGKLGECERPLRAQTMQGERVALACSETVPAGTKMHFSVKVRAPGLDKALEECWEYASDLFMGAWRGSGKGTAIIEEVKA